MNRNDVVVAPSSGESPKVSLSLGLPRPSSSSSSVASRSKKQTAFHSSVKGPSSCSKGILEERSVHLSLPSFHQKGNSGGGQSAVWKCAGCSHENRSALSNECSVCGMIRDLACDDNGAGGASHRPRWDEDISESNASYSSFMMDDFDGHQSENSLSLHNSVVGLTDAHHDRDDESKVSRDEDVVITMSSAKGHASMPANFHHSFSERSVARSVRSTTSSRRRRPQRRSWHRTLRRQNSADSTEENVGFDGNSSVMSFCNWDGNEKIQSWECTACTFLNENPLHLMCEVCGTRRNQPNGSNHNNGSAHSHNHEDEEKVEEELVADAVDDDDDYFEEEELYLLQREQMRELVEIQRGILAEFGSRSSAAIDQAASDTAAATSSQPSSSFNTRDMQREISQVQASIPGTSTISRGPRLDYSSMDSLDCDADEGKRLRELLAAQKDIMKDFKTKRSATDSDSFNSDRWDIKPAASASASSSASPVVHGGLSPMPATNESNFFGSNASNEAPSGCVSLKDTMRAAGGQLRHEDLTLPLLWGDAAAGSLKKTGGGPGKGNNNRG